MIRREANGAVVYSFAALEKFPEVVHGITGRHGGVSTGPYASLNLSTGLGDDPGAVARNVELACEAVGVARGSLITLHQRHTANLREVHADECGKVFDHADGLLTDDADTPLLLRFADCTPILLYDPVHRACCAVHSGWKGTVQGIARAAVTAMAEQFGTRPGDIVAGIGPCIGPCCYEVGEEVVSAARQAFGDTDGLFARGSAARPNFDLWAANARWLSDAGVRNFEVAGLCTACRPDDFFSYRRDAGRTGHFGALIAIRS
jgi:hypothetical protein